MSFLYTDNSTGEVKIAQEAMVLPSVISLYNTDRIGGNDKPFFKKVIKFIYHQYYNEHPVFKNLSYKERRQRVLELHYNNHESVIKDIEHNVRVKAVIEDYLSCQRVFSEKKYMVILNKIEELSDHLDGISLVIKKNIEKVISVDVFDNEGNTLKRDIPIKTTIEVDNSKEYYAALEMIEKVMDIEERVRGKMVKEKADKELNPKSMIDEGKFVEMKK